MASTYTANTGIEKITSGEQAGTWGTTTNTNFDIIDDALNGVLSVTVSGNTTLTSNDGTLSSGHHKVILLIGTPSGAFNLTIDPNDQQKWYFISNSTGQTVTIKQGGGSGTTVALINSTSAIIYADGAGSNANVAKVDPVVTTANITDANVTLAKMAVNSIDSDQYVDGSIDTAHIADSQITVAKMAANSVDSAQYVDGSIDTAHIADSQITVAKMAANSVDSAQYVDGSIDTAHIADSQITVAKMAANSVDSAQYVDGSIDAAHIANNAVALGTKTTGNYVATITAGTGISGSSSSEAGTPTIALATAGAGAATYGSTADTTKIDTITLDAYGRVTAVATGAVGGASGILQILQDTATSNTNVGTSATSFGLSQAIVTSASSHKVLVQANISVDFDARQVSDSGDGGDVPAMGTVTFKLFRGSSDLGTVGTVGQELNFSKDVKLMCPILYLDSPGSAASHTYEIKAQESSSMAATVNVSTSFLIVSEIAV